MHSNLLVGIEEMSEVGGSLLRLMMVIDGRRVVCRM
jgi:hypothetical protein